MTDDGTGDGGGDSGGHGLVGMRERISVYGGDLEAGPRPEGGYRLQRDAPGEQRMSLTVLLVDDQSLVRTGFRMILEAEDGHRGGRRGRRRARGRSSRPAR